MAGSSQYRFGVLAKIVKHMKTRHQEGDDQALTIDDILDETNQLDIGSSVKNVNTLLYLTSSDKYSHLVFGSSSLYSQWLQTEALQNNPKIDVSPDGLRFIFKPVYKIRDGKSLLRLLKQQDLKGMGGVLLEDVQDSLPHCEKALKNRANEIAYITRPTDKKKILFYNDRSASLTVDEEFQKLWRSVTVDAMDDAKIDEYLEKQGTAIDDFVVSFTKFKICFSFFFCRHPINARPRTEETIDSQTKEIIAEETPIQEATRQ